MDEFEKKVFENLDLYRELNEKYTSRKINLDPVEMLKKVNDLKDKTRGDKLNTYKFNDNNYLYDSNFYFLGNKGQFDIQGLIYVSNNKEAEIIKKYNIGLGQYKRNIVDITQEIPIDEKIEDFIIRNYETRNKYDDFTYKWNARKKAMPVRKNGKVVGTMKDTFKEIKFDDEVFRKKKEEQRKKAKEFSDKLIGQFGLDKLPEEMNKLGEITKELDKNINSVGKNVNNAVVGTAGFLVDLTEEMEDFADDFKELPGDIKDGIDKITGGNIPKDRKPRGLNHFFKNFTKSILTILELIIKLTKMGFKITELIIIISPILVIVYTFYKINISLYNINDYGKEKGNTTQI